MRECRKICDGCGLVVEREDGIQSLYLSFHCGNGTDFTRDRISGSADFCSIGCAMKYINEYIRDSCKNTSVKEKSSSST
jgi:hypothetical protein